MSGHFLRHGVDMQFICQACVFSYLVTFSPLPDNSKDEPQAVIIWDVRTGYRKRSFHCENASAWPIFK